MRLVSFENLKFDNLSPIYMQIIKNFRQQCASGEVKDGDEMPSRRTLSALLGVNPNTVQKAYKMLEDDGLITSRGGAKSLVTLSERQLQGIRKELLQNEVAGAVNALKAGGATKKEAVEIFERVWDETETGPASGSP